MNNSTADQDFDSELLYSIVDEHRHLADRIDAASYEINNFFAEPANRSPSDVQHIISMLEDLRDTAQTHFQHEETLMIKNNFPGAVYHKRDHDYLLKSLIHYTSSLSHGTVPFSPDTAVNLRSWLTYHIKKYDEAYVTFIEAGKVEARD